MADSYDSYQQPSGGYLRQEIPHFEASGQTGDELTSLNQGKQNDGKSKGWSLKRLMNNETNAGATPIELSSRNGTNSINRSNEHYDEDTSRIIMNAQGYSDNEDDFDDNDIDDIDKIDKWKLFLGLFFIFICIIDWVAMSEVLQLIESNYSKPYFLRWCVNSGYMLIIFGWLILKKLNSKWNKQFRTQFNRASVSDSTDFVINEKNRKPLWKRILFASWFVNFVGIIAGYLWYVSLNITTASVSNTIYQSQVAFVYPLSAVVMGAAITFQKDMGVVISMLGVVLIAVGTQSDSDDSSDSGTNTVAGIIEVVISTVFYAVYEVAIDYYGEKHFNQETLIQDTLYFQFWMGVWTLFTMWPFFIILDVTGIEEFELPSTGSAWASILIPIFMDLIFTAAFFSAINLTNAFIVAMGTLLVIPTSYVADLIWHGYSVTTSAIVGSICILVGFILMEIPIVKFIRKKLGIKKSSLCFSKRNRRARIAALKRKSMQDQAYFEYYK